MMFSLNTNSIRSVLKRRGARAMSPWDLPKYAMDQFGLRAINFSTAQLAGLSPKDLELIRVSGDRVGCSCLLLSQTDALMLGDVKGDKAIEGIERMGRVIKAAALMGCNAVSLSIKSKDTEAAFEQVAESMKHVLEFADRAEMNVLISPTAGLTQDPDRLTDLLKGIGGFRIGTMPDFDMAVKTGDAAGYLKKLTPYASVVNASTLGFSMPEPGLGGGDGENGGSGGDGGQDDGASKLSGLDALAAELEGMMLEDDPVPVHEGYDLPQLVRAVAAVGFDGTIAIDYRGSGDGAVGVMQSRDAIEAALESLSE